jgi:Flp pilus assembly protein TadD
MYYRAFRERRPVADLGHSIRVYWAETWPEAAPDSEKPSRTPRDIETVRVLARGLMNLEAYDHAIFHYRQYLKERPDNVVALANLGAVLTKNGSRAEGIELLERAWRLDPTNELVRHNLVFALLGEGYASRAADYAVEAVRMTPRDAQAHYLLGMANVGARELDDAAREFAVSLQIDPRFGPALEAMDAIRRMGR